MSAFLTIEGVTTPLSLSYGSERITNAIALDSLQFAENSDAAKQTFSVTKSISSVTIQLYALAADSQRKPMTFYIVDDSSQEGFTIACADGVIRAWMISLEQLGLQRELITIEAEQITVSV